MPASPPEPGPDRSRSSRAIRVGDGERVATGSGRRRTAVVAAIGLVLGLGVLSRTGGGESDDAVTSEIRQVPATAETATVTTRSARITVPPTEPIRVEPLVLGEQTGLWLFYGGDDPLQRLDLDSGELDLYGLRASPVAAVGDQLILAAANGSIGWVGLDDPGEQAQGWQPAHPALGDEPGRLWLLFEGESPSALLMDVSTDAMVDRRPLPDALPLDGRETGTGAATETEVAPVGLVPGPALVSTEDGVEGFDGDGYRLLGDGRVPVFDRGRALVERCDDAALICERSWHDRANWQPILSPLAAPLDDTLASGPVRSAELLADGRWLSVVDANGTPFLFSLDPARRADPIELLAAATFTVSPDGRWLAVTARSGAETAVEIIDLGIGADAEPTSVATVGAFINPSGGDLLFVERP